MNRPKSLFKAVFIIAVFFGFVGSTKAQQQGDPPTVRELVVGAFQITRTNLISLIISSDSLMVFKTEKKVNGLDNYIGVDNYKSTVQLIGDDKDLQSARFTFAFTTEHDVNKLQYMRMSYFVVSIAGKSGLDWFYGPSGKFSKNPTEAINEHQQLDYLNADFKYDPKDKAISIIFTKFK
ncbi:hypothetical protein [Mucilaginibacter gilvus]|uniref:Uncharacterized protein n=1 Tax=Mucilaginibacter gilvus TaxID=2305909 RepID=A0A444MIH9_9SPHI|nr:hypothetical protein [Mucilaginibacter gilvus]RWY47916.1 hypothetical protein EPL05_20195 [Mucilaginibacter gilvus]